MQKIDKQHILIGTALGIVLGGGILIGLSFVGVKILLKLGIPSYTSLTPTEIQSVYTQLDQNCKILSRYCGQTGDCHWCRGVYQGCGNGILYYRWEQCGDNNASLHLYTLPFEMWTTDASWNPFAEHGQLVFPVTNQPKQGGY